MEEREGKGKEGKGPVYRLHSSEVTDEFYRGSNLYQSPQRDDETCTKQTRNVCLEHRIQRTESALSQSNAHISKLSFNIKSSQETTYVRHLGYLGVSHGQIAFAIACAFAKENVIWTRTPDPDYFLWKSAGKPRQGPIFNKRQLCRAQYRKGIRDGQKLDTMSLSLIHI